MTNHVIDAQALLWFFEGNPRLGTEALKIPDSSSSQFVIPTIALAEVIWVVKRGRTRVLNWQEMVDALNHDHRFRFAAITPDIVLRSMDFIPQLEMHDAQIVATALLLRDQRMDAMLVTCDRRIIESKIVPTIW